MTFARPFTTVGPWMGLAPALGVLFAVLAYKAETPLALPAIMTIAGLFAASLYRPVIGVAVAMVLIPLGGLLDGAPEILDVPPKVLPLAWTAMIIPICLLRAGTGSWQSPPLVLTVGLFALIGVVAIAATPELAQAAPAANALLIGIVLFFATTLAVRERRDAYWILRAMAVASSFFGAFALYQLATGSSGIGFFSSSGSLVGRAVAGFDQPNQLGGFLLLAVAPMVAGVLLDRRARWLHVLGIALALGGIYASFSRGAMLGLLVIPLVMIGGRRLIPILVPAVIIGALALPNLLVERFAQFSGSAEGSRIDIWSTALSIFSDNPVAGAGLGAFPDAYAQIRIPGKEFLPDTLFEPPPHAHNLILNLMAEEGMLGLISFVVLIGLALFWAMRLRRLPDRWMRTMGSALLAAFTGFLVHNLFDVTLLSRGGYIWVLLGLLSALVMIARRERQAGGVGVP